MGQNLWLFESAKTFQWQPFNKYSKQMSNIYLSIINNEEGGRKSFQMHTSIDSSPILLGRKHVLVLLFLLTEAAVRGELQGWSTLNFCHSGVISISWVFLFITISQERVWQYSSFTCTDKNTRKICQLEEGGESCCHHTHSQP